MAEVKSLTEEGIKSVSPQNWQRYIGKAIRDENEYAELDNLDILEKCGVTVKPVTIDVNYDSSDESDWLTDDEIVLDQENSQNSPQIQEPGSEIPMCTVTYETEMVVPVPVDNPPEIETTAIENTATNSPEQQERICHTCNHNFSKKNNLQSHLLTLKKCTRCDKIFCGKRAVTRLKCHQKSCGGVNLGFVCEQCEKQFQFKSRYLRHVKTCGKTFECIKCKHIFKFKIGLVKHKCPNF